MMWSLGARCRVGAVVILFVWVFVLGLFGLMKPVPNGCGTSYMSYPTYIEVPDVPNSSSSGYGLFLYHEGRERIDFDEYLTNLDGFPVLFIPGNGGSYKQVRSLAAESSKAYRRGPLEPTFYQEASFDYDEMEKTLLEDLNNSSNGQYTYKLNWFAVDLKGEQSAMDGRIIEDQSSYVVHAIHRILDQYQCSYESRLRDGASVWRSPPTNVILVGHSMGGFVARTAVIHPQLRKSAVETIFTFSSPHQCPPIAVQPSLAHLFSEVNSEWRKGYEAETSNSGQFKSGPDLSHVVVVSIFGGVYDYQVRSKLSTLAGIVPSSNSVTVGSSGIKNVLLSMEHQSIIWCNQLAVQVSHTLLGLIDPEIGQPYSSPKKRVSIVRKMLQSRVPESLTWAKKMQLSRTRSFTVKDAEVSDSPLQDSFSCPSAVNWIDNDFLKDLYIETPSFIILSMDGRKRWLDIKELGSNGKGHFIFLTNLAPCSGVRIHLWPERHNLSSDSRLSFDKRITDVTRKMVQISVAGPVLRQVKSGSQNAQASPYALLQLNPEEMCGFRFLTIAVARHLTVSGGSPLAAAMAVGQFFNPDEGVKAFSSSMLFRMSYAKKEMFLKEEHPLALNLSFSVSLGMLPLALKLRTEGCRPKSTSEQTKDIERRHCKLRCFSPFALAWDSTFGLHVISNIYDETLTVESSPAMSDSGPGSNKTNVLLLVDPRCSYKISLTVSLTAAGSRFLLFYSSQIAGFMIAAAFFALMRQARAWELESPLPSVLSSVELNLRIPLPLVLLSLLPILSVLFFKLLTAQELPPAASFLSLSVLCYLIANGVLVVLIFCSQILLYAAATTHIFVRKCWLSWKDKLHHAFLDRTLSFFSVFISLMVLQPRQRSSHIVIAFVAILLVWFVHPALGLTLLLVSHVSQSHAALTSFLTASSRSHTQTIELSESRVSFRSSLLSESSKKIAFDHLPHVDCGFPDPKSVRSFAESQTELFNYWHGLLILHLLSTVMLGPSLFAWIQRLQMGRNFTPYFIDSALSVAVILHGLCAWTSDINSIPLSLAFIPGYEVGISFSYLLAGFYTCIVALSSAPYMALYAVAAIGIVTLVSKVAYLRNRGRGEYCYRNNRRHYHRQ